MCLIISSVMKQDASEINNSITLSKSMSRRIDEMAENVEKNQLIGHFQVKHFALQLDEST